MPGDDYDLGPGYWDDGSEDALEEAFYKGAKSRDREVAELRMNVDDVLSELASAEAEVAELKALLAAHGIAVAEEATE